MRARAMLWCGRIRPRQQLEPTAFANDIEMAVRSVLRRGVNPHDISAHVGDRSLLPDGFSGAPHEPTLDSLDRVMRSMAQDSKSEDAVIFVATNHGVRKGLLTAGEPPNPFADEEPKPVYLTPTFLQERLDAIAGQQIVLIATCHAGVFLPLGNERRVVLASCGADEKDYTYTGDHPPRALFLYEVLSHWAGTSLGGYPAPEPCSLTEAFERARQNHCPHAHCTGSASWPLVTLGQQKAPPTSPF